jgi:hypothetical protein
MMATLAFLSALSALPAQDGQLRFANERPTYCMWGATRTANKYLPGDVYFLSFDIENLSVDKNGKVSYRMSMEVTDKNGKRQFKADPEKTELISSLGGARLPAFVAAPLGTDVAPGEYTVKVEVEDVATKKKIELAKKFEVGPKEFGIVRPNTSIDTEAKIPAPSVAAVPGQALWFHFGIVGFKRDEKTKKPSVSLEWRVLDESGKPTLDKPITGEFNETSMIDENWSLIPTSFLLTLNRVGKFTVEIKAVDKLADKTATLKFPIAVLDAK